MGIVSLALLLRPKSLHPKGDSPFALLALLLFALPLLLTLQKLVALLTRGERSHQLLAEPSEDTAVLSKPYLLGLIYFLYSSPSAFNTPAISLWHVSHIPPISNSWSYSFAYFPPPFSSAWEA